MDELDYMENVTLTDGGITTLTNTQNTAEELFGISNNPDGTISILPTVQEEPEEKITDEIEKQIKTTQEQLDELKKQNPNTHLSDQRLKELYEDFGNDGFILF